LGCGEGEKRFAEARKKKSVRAGNAYDVVKNIRAAIIGVALRSEGGGDWSRGLFSGSLFEEGGTCVAMTEKNSKQRAIPKRKILCPSRG